MATVGIDQGQQQEREEVKTADLASEPHLGASQNQREEEVPQVWSNEQLQEPEDGNSTLPPISAVDSDDHLGGSMNSRVGISYELDQLSLA